MKVKQLIKKLLISIIVIIMTSNFILPNNSHAIDAKLGKPVAALITFLGDGVENGLQQFFIGRKAIYEYTEDDGLFGTQIFGSTTIKANIQYSVANIVANNIPIFDINFFGEGNSIGEPNPVRVRIEYSLKLLEEYCNRTIEIINNKSINGENISQNDVDNICKEVKQQMNDEYGDEWHKVMTNELDFLRGNPEKAQKYVEEINKLENSGRIL